MLKPCSIIFTSIVLVFVCHTSNAIEIQAFKAQSLSAIEKHYADKAFLLLLWRSDCAPCHQEFSLLSKMHRQLQLPIVLLATDSIDDAEQLQQLLSRYSFPIASAWAFGESNEQRLQYNIDPQWRGELPRSYLYFKDGKRQAKSGRLHEQQLLKWQSLARE